MPVKKTMYKLVQVPTGVVDRNWVKAFLARVDPLGLTLGTAKAQAILKATLETATDARSKNGTVGLLEIDTALARLSLWKDKAESEGNYKAAKDMEALEKLVWRLEAERSALL